ncbi:MAG: hypothetical protein K6E29_02995 [Cyanobacteria bacterium RUI128]|nr:hypothetical protein [Cyanobacteria bacterium RUI128]
MNINQVSNDQSFTGNVIVKGAISAQQRHLFDSHRPALEQKIKDMPFDLFVAQSKSKKTISLTTNVKDAETFVVHKNKQNFEEAANLAIRDGMGKSEAYKKQVKANEILNYYKLRMLHVISGNFKEAREAHKQMAKLAVEDFDTYKQVTNFKIANLPPEVNKILLVNSLKYKAYCAFSKKTPEEKQLEQMNKEYIREMKAKKQKPKPQIVYFPNIY